VNDIVASSHLFGNVIEKVPILDGAVSRDKAWGWSLSLGRQKFSLSLQQVTWESGRRAMRASKENRE